MTKEMMEKHHDNSSGITGLILGIFAVLSGVPGILIGFIGFWFSLSQFKHGRNKWAKWGLALNIIGFILGIILAIYLYWYVAGAVANLQGLSQVNNYGAAQ